MTYGIKVGKNQRASLREDGVEIHRNTDRGMGVVEMRYTMDARDCMRTGGHKGRQKDRRQ